MRTDPSFARRLLSLFDALKNPDLVNRLIETYVFGQPFRLRRLRAALRHCRERGGDLVWFTRPRDVARFCTAQEPGIIPGG